MQKAAEKMDFEKAAELRDMIADLRDTTKPTRRFTRGSLPSTIDPIADVRELADALRLPHLPRIMECFDISNISATHVVASMVCFRDGVPDKDHYRRYRVRTVEGQDDFASMAEVVRRRYSRILLEARAANPDTAEFSQESGDVAGAPGGQPLRLANPGMRSPVRQMTRACRSACPPHHCGYGRGQLSAAVVVLRIRLARLLITASRKGGGFY
jgi:hypothetical protein